MLVTRSITEAPPGLSIRPNHIRFEAILGI
jgi:hypothetical protein